MTDPRNGTKTLGIKLPPALHAQFSLIAQLDDISLGTAVLQAVELYVAHKQSEPDFAKRAAAALAEIEQEAAARKAAIEGLFGKSSPQATAATPVAKDEPADTGASKAPRGRRTPEKE